MQMEAIGYDSTEDKCIDEESRGKLWGTLFLRGRIKEECTQEIKCIAREKENQENSVL